MNIIAVDWAKQPHKRSAYLADPAKQTIRRLETDVSLEQLLKIASGLTSPTLIGIDAAIGLPAGLWHQLVEQHGVTANNFIDFLLGDSLPEQFLEPVKHADAWSPRQPFFVVPPGKGALTAFHQATAHGLSWPVLPGDPDEQTHR